MPDPLTTLSGAGPIRAELEPAPRRSEPSRSFADHLEATEAPPPDEPSPVLEAIGDAVRSIGRGEQFVDGAIARARRGKNLEPGQLLALQAGVYRYTQELELAAKLVDKATGAVKQTLQSQQ
ncbi:MAG: hypothetical protein JJ863_20110 [Deltaproteobacteria bacterium]|nr:hypothetical protein [Deltaproteobacteria bacterium]